MATAPAPNPSPRFTAATGPTVLQVLPALATGGVERGTVDMAWALIDSGWRAIVASSGGMMVREVERAGARHATLPLDSRNPLAIRANAARLAELIREAGVDLVHARSRAPAWSAWLAAQRTGVPFITTFHAPYDLGFPFKRRYNAVMARGARIIAISEFIAQHVANEYGVDPAKIVVIPRGVDVRSFDPATVSAERVARLAHAWRLPDGVPVVMLPGRLTRWKGQTVLIEALSRLGREDVIGVLVGSDQGRAEYRGELEKLIQRRGLGGRMRLVDQCNDMPAAYMLADIVVSASTDPEGFGRVSAEAQAMGRLVVASDHGGSREIVRPGETGWLVPPADSSALAETLGRALTLPGDQRTAMAQRAIDRVRAFFTRERMCERTLDVYEEVILEARSRRAA